MRDELPAYYTELAPFRALFQTANPILTYHKLGPRPGGVRLKGLYVSAGTFSRQLQELRDAGFTSGTLSRWESPPNRQVVITFDDGYVNALQYGLAPLAKCGFRAIQFLPVNFLGKRNEWDVAVGEAPESIMDPAQVREWLSAGHDIGSHTLSHPFLSKLPAEHAKEEIASSRRKLEDLFGRPVDHFCYPYGDYNERVRDLVQEAGYKTACTTEWGVNSSGDCSWTLKRLTVRYPSLKWRNIGKWMAYRVNGLKTPWSRSG